MLPNFLCYWESWNKLLREFWNLIHEWQGVVFKKGTTEQMSPKRRVLYIEEEDRNHCDVKIEKKFRILEILEYKWKGKSVEQD